MQIVPIEFLNAFLLILVNLFLLTYSIKSDDKNFIQVAHNTHLQITKNKYFLYIYRYLANALNDAN